MASLVPDSSKGLMVIGMICFGVYALHVWVLARTRSLTTHSARRRVLVWVALLLCAGLAGALSLRLPDEEVLQELVLWRLIPLMLWLPGFVIYSMPGKPLASLPLLIHYFILFLILSTGGAAIRGLLIFAYLPLAGYLFPCHRRLVEYLRPSRLPRLQNPKIPAGVTLIELLIVIAVTAILTASIAGTAGVAYHCAERGDDWRQAVSLAQDEIALLRARESLPDLGRHPVEPELAKVYAFADQAEVEIRPGPRESLREARVHVRLRNGEGFRHVELAALIATRPLPAEAVP